MALAIGPEMGDCPGRHWRGEVQVNWKRVGLTCAVLATVLGLYAWQRPEQVERLAEVARPGNDRAAFDRWLSAAPGRREEFARFEAYLARAGVADVVPVWQLTRVDGSVADHCAGGPFALPPERLWANAVPVLRLVRARVVPAVGRVEVASAYRAPRANRCSRGASRSKHLSFAGIDFVAPQQRDNRVLFAKLCAVHARHGPADRFGLGAYFDPDQPAQNQRGRFHVDAAGFRSWGRDYHARSSGCAKLA
jgi:Peptidase M15